MRWAWADPSAQYKNAQVGQADSPSLCPTVSGQSTSTTSGVTAHTSHCGSYRAHTKPFPDTTALRGPSDTLDLPLAPWLPETKDARTGGILCIIFLGGLAQGPQMGA